MSRTKQYTALLVLTVTACAAQVPGNSRSGKTGAPNATANIASGTGGAPSSPLAMGGAAAPGSTTTPNTTPLGSGPALSGPPQSIDTSGVLPLTRLTQVEYAHTVHDLLGDQTFALGQLAGDTIGRSGYLDGIIVGPSEVTALMELGGRISTKVALTPTSLVPCDLATAGEDACASRFITEFGARAFRRPLDPDEVTDFNALYSTAKTTLGLDYAGRIRVLTSAFLQSAPFLYHHEVGLASLGTKDGALVRLGPYQVASRLSYLLTRSMPDQPLLDAANRGDLATSAGVLAQAERLLAEVPANQTLLADFVEQWLLLDTLPTITKAPSFDAVFGDAARASVRQEISGFSSSTLLDPKHQAGLSDFFTSRSANLDPPLATLYGVPGVTGSTQLPAERAGILTRAAYLATQANPTDGSAIRRGKVLRTRLLCQEIPVPPPNVPKLPPVQPGDTQRQRLQRHTTDPTCSACHQLMDPLGFAFENYDTVGQYRTVDNGQPVDATGQITAVSGGPIAFANGIELSTLLPTLPEVRECALRQFFRFMAGRLETDADVGHLQVANQALTSEPRLAYDKMILALVQSKAFTHRNPYEGEVLP